MYTDLVTCELCGRKTPCIKLWEQSRIYVLPLFIIRRTTTHFLCPACKRKSIVKSIPLSLLTQHFLWPVIFVMFEIPDLLSTYASGHSVKALELLGLGHVPTKGERIRIFMRNVLLRSLYVIIVALVIVVILL